MHWPPDAVRRKLLAAAGLLGLAGAGGLLAPCAGAAGAAEATGTDPQSTPLRGAGATLPSLLYAAWAEAYERETGNPVDYRPSNSIAGIDAVERGQADFGASDVPLLASELQRRGLAQFAAVVGAVVPVVNLTGLAPDGLTLSGAVLGDIFLGRVRHWNDAAITALNPGLALPRLNITTVHRGAPSGTTFVWSRYLARSNAEWRRRFGAATVIDWPTGVEESDSEGLASSVQRIKASIGYVGFSFARLHGLGCAALQAGAGRGVAMADSDSFRLGAASSFAEATRLASASAPQVPGEPQAPGGSQAPGGPQGVTAATGAAWPITSPCYILIRTGTDARAVNAQVQAFFRWAWRKGEPIAVDLGFTPLPASSIELTERRWELAASPKAGPGR